MRKTRRVDESGSIEGVPCGRLMFEGEVERGREIAVELYGESSQQSHIFHVDLGGEDASHRGGANGRIWVRQKMLEVYPGPVGWMSTEAAPEEARKGQKRPGAESKLAVDAVGDGVGDSCVNAGGVERSACAAAAVQHNARTLSGPPSTRATVAMDGGVTDGPRLRQHIVTELHNRW